MINIMTLLTAGPSSDISVTIPEGKNIYQIGEILEGRQIISDKKDFIEFAKNPRFTDSLGIPATTTEGYLYPTLTDSVRDIFKNNNQKNGE